MRRPATARLINSDHTPSALYVAGKTEWLEQVGPLVAARDHWRMMAFGSMATAFLAVSGAVWDHGNNHPVPYVVEVDHIGAPLPISRLDVAPPLDQRILRAQLGHWIYETRSVLVDVTAQRKMVSDLFAMIDKHGDAYSFLTDWFENNSPFDRAKNETVNVQVQAVNPVSATTWQIQWGEDHRTRDGRELTPETWQALVTISVTPPKTDASVFQNPTGLFVESIHWSKLETGRL